MHRAAFHFIKALGVPSRVTRTGKCKRSQKDAEDNSEDDNNKNDDAEDDDTKDDNGEDNGDKLVDDTDLNISTDVDASAEDASAMAETLIVDFEPSNTVGKLLAFVNQVWMSSEGVREYLAHSCRMHNIKSIELCL